MSDFQSSPGGEVLAKLVDLTLASAAASIDSGAIIPPGYSCLRIITFGLSTHAANQDPLLLRFNGDSGSNYQQTGIIYGSDGGTYNFHSTTQTGVSFDCAGSSADTQDYSCFELIVLGYSGATRKTCNYTGGAPLRSSFNVAHSGHAFWRSTAAITRVSMVTNSGDNVAAGSRLLVYGM